MDEQDEVAVFVIFEVDGSVDKNICKTVFTMTIVVRTKLENYGSFFAFFSEGHSKPGRC